MKRGIRIFTEAKTLDPNQDLKINGALVSMLKRAGFQVKSFKATKKGYNEIWSGEFKTKNAILPMSVNKYGDVFYQDKNIGRIDKSSKIIDWMKAIKRNNKWVESVDEAISVPIEIGDTVLGGKFKNKRVVVKNIGKNEKGDITINGKPLLKYRLIQQEGKLNEMDYQKLIPIQLSNIARLMGELNVANRKGNAPTVKRLYKKLDGLVKSLGKSVDAL